MQSSVFHDSTGKRRKWVRAWVALSIVLALATVATLIGTILVQATPPAPSFTVNADNSDISALAHNMRRFLRERGVRGPWLPPVKASKPWKPVVVAFYTPDDDSSTASLRRNIGRIDWISASDFNVLGPDHKLTQMPDKQLRLVLAQSGTRPRLMPLVQNSVDGKWDSVNTAALLHSPHLRAAFLDDLTARLAAYGAGGAVFDIEALPPSAQADYKTFLAEAAAKWHPRGWLVTLAAPVGDDSWDLRGLARVADRVLLMAYDEHWEEGTAGPIASQPWFVAALHRTVNLVGPAKAIVCIGAYSYDWHDRTTDDIAVEQAWTNAHDNHVPVRFDPVSGNAGFSYKDARGERHVVWTLDAASAHNQIAATRAYAPAGLAIWRLGEEDPGLWTAMHAAITGTRPDLSDLGTTNNVDIQGQGELLRLSNTPTDGVRQISFGKDGLIHGEEFKRLPTPFVVQRAGAQPGLVALTFDDGPDSRWTPQILDILKREQVPATFFVVGENALTEPFLLRRIVAEGHEIGNHSFSHPNMANASIGRIKWEVNLTQRLIEAYTGHATRLFRAPFFGDAEPTTMDELEPARAAQNQGYLNIGLHVDPNDWQTPGVDAIVDHTIEGVADDKLGNVVLLHDSGGDRTQTIAALPRIIEGLKARGYRFVPVSELAGLTPAQVNPPVSASDQLAISADTAIFGAAALLQEGLGTLFVCAIILGLARALTLSALALKASREEKLNPPPSRPWQGLVSVLIPAFNEAKVIESSVRRVLASIGAQVEVIVIDDGSKDSTSAVVRQAFGHDPRVQLLTLANGGKANALNRGLGLAKGEIVVALDADTQFEPDTIAKLARWFHDPRLAAVAGNAKVGNRTNLVTRWQATEYVTAQNLERRALVGLDAMTVIPGAVGAWRASALAELGGYPADTLAEDQDMTIAIQRAGWKVAHDPDAIAWTEAPDTLRGLSKQRFRWAYGTLQCLWKHRAIFREGRPAGLARIGLPQAWAFQIGFGLISPLIDLALLVSMGLTAYAVSQHGLTNMTGTLEKMGLYWLAFTAVDVACGWIAYRLDGRERYNPLLLLSQRFVYRQLMYWVVIRAVVTALTGPLVGWGKLERTGTVQLATA